jgi:hypothetical protein
MKKQFFTLIVTAIFTIANQSNAQSQNTFPISGNVGIGTGAPNQKLEVIGGNIFTDGSVKANNFFKSYGDSGWINESHGGGWYMTEKDWIRSFGAKNVYCDKVIRADQGFQVDGLQVIDAGAGWHRTYGATGWYNGTYGGGWNMSDNTWIRSYGSKSVLCDKIIRADQGFQVGDLPVIDAGGGWHRTYGATGWYNGTFGGGMYMEDNTWVRIYNNKQFYSSNTIRTDGELQVGSEGDRMVVKGNGNVGIGTINPSQKLEVNGSALIKGNLSSNYLIALPQNTINEGGEIFLKGSNSSLKNYYVDTYANNFRIFTDGAVRFLISDNGNAGVGTNNPDERLTVKGKIHAEEVRIDLQVPADYVFQKYYTGFSSLKSNYNMPTLSEVEKFTKVNNHLPDVPSAKEIKEKGLQVGEMSNILLQKIEEMTLYIIEQNKRIEALESKMSTK